MDVRELISVALELGDSAALRKEAAGAGLIALGADNRNVTTSKARPNHTHMKTSEALR
ncbi:MAG TPA: hypothetical protein VJV58_04020 [Bradyrhizobium sp.]|uniref:hypothetical protein n=1 Tax=Bradyrhizobium sp. TaxID=376 RepID=UPI002B4912CA|nr:hypothetical protein [Bradyrhizobium sp.]HKO70081.1 hypothetical protein [Bradyrhizobium sp.]